MMLTAARHLVQLQDEMLDISRIETQTLSLSMEAVPVHDLIADTLELVRPLALSRGVRLDPPPPPDSSQYVHADEQRLRQVLLNLLSAGWPGGISPPGSHRTERESLPSLRSSHP
jgi:two-component system, sensor histidine kinase and response regulator